MTFQLNDVDFFFMYYTIYHIVSMLFFEIKMQFSFFLFHSLYVQNEQQSAA